ncbi:hypothetical protein AV540_00010 [Brevibacillus parabrevis]|uniref:hypothetical protein n=1 Tax=Brevibacillus parabrevis TaxID=54914 RepID=UPI0007AB9DBB|nr:hypothetical protein [Brevibacillus parabrevis]KZE55772.1 hypothetical protein AV540_00010 [Brevibacillus parabrevis]
MAADAARLKEMRKEMKVLSKEAGLLSRELGRTSKGIQQMVKEFSASFDQMKKDMQNVQNSMKELNQVEVKPKVDLREVIGKFDEFKTELAGVGAFLTGLAIGTTLDDVKADARAAAKERSYYVARGKSEEETKRFEELANKLTILNPDLKPDQARALVAQTENSNPNMAAEVARLGVTTRFASDDILKMMETMGATTGVNSASRLGNALQYMNNTGEGNVSTKLVDSIAEFNADNGKLLKTPEKLAAVVGEIGKLSNDDRKFSSVLDKSRDFSGEKEFVQLLQTQYQGQGETAGEAKKKAETEAKAINDGLSSLDNEEQRIAMGKLILSVAAMTDKAAQKKVMTSLGGGPGSEIEKSIKIASGESNPHVSNEVDKSYAAATKADPFFAGMQEQVAARNEAMAAIGKITTDLSVITSWTAKLVAGVAGWFNSLSDGARQVTVYTVTALVALTSGTSMLVKFWDKTKDFAVSTKDWISGLFGKKDANTAEQSEAATEALAGGKGKGECCCCADGAGGGKDTNADGANPRKRKQKRRRPGSGNAASANAGGNRPNPQATPPDTARPTPQAAPPDTPSPNPPDTGNGGKGSWKKIAKAGLRKLPFIGGLLGLATIAGSENKVDTAMQVGAEALGNWGGMASGAATGAMIGSIVPGIGTAIGGAVGGLIGGFGGSMLGSAVFEKAKEWWNKPSGPTEPQPSQISTATPAGQVAPPFSPGVASASQPQSVSLTIPQLTISLQADGVLQDIPTMLKMLNDPTVSQRIRAIIERALLDALETRGGVVT